MTNKPNLPAKSNLECRNMATVLAIDKDENAEPKYTVRGSATTFDVPYLLYEDGDTKYYEVIKSGALDGADMSDVIMNCDHIGKPLARTINNTLSLDVTATSLDIEGDLSHSQAGRDLHEEILAGLITKMSWAFVVSEDEYENDYDQRTYTRIIKKIKKVYDVSAVSRPANEGTHINARNNAKAYVDSIINQQAMALELAKLKYNF